MYIVSPEINSYSFRILELSLQLGELFKLVLTFQREQKHQFQLKLGKLLSWDPSSKMIEYRYVHCGLRLKDHGICTDTCSLLLKSHGICACAADSAKMYFCETLLATSPYI